MGRTILIAVLQITDRNVADFLEGEPVKRVDHRREPTTTFQKEKYHPIRRTRHTPAFHIPTLQSPKSTQSLYRMTNNEVLLGCGVCHTLSRM